MSTPPPGATLPDPLALESVIITHKLRQRSYRGPNFEIENRALVELMQLMATTPDRVLHALVERALILCRAGSAGISIEEGREAGDNFCWRAVAGEFGPFLNARLPRWFSPCGTVLEQDRPLLMSNLERAYPLPQALKPGIEEVLLVPFRTARGEAVGTLWVISHDPTRTFDREDLRIAESLSAFAGAAYTALGHAIFGRGGVNPAQ
jgi:GAF domain-containing protein